MAHGAILGRFSRNCLFGRCKRIYGRFRRVRKNRGLGEKIGVVRADLVSGKRSVVVFRLTDRVPGKTVYRLRRDVKSILGEVRRLDARDGKTVVLDVPEACHLLIRNGYHLDRLVALDEDEIVLGEKPGNLCFIDQVALAGADALRRIPFGIVSGRDELGRHIAGLAGVVNGGLGGGLHAGQEVDGTLSHDRLGLALSELGLEGIDVLAGQNVADPSGAVSIDRRDELLVVLSDLIQRADLVQDHVDRDGKAERRLRVSQGFQPGEDRGEEESTQKAKVLIGSVYGDEEGRLFPAQVLNDDRVVPAHQKPSYARDREDLEDQGDLLEEVAPGILRTPFGIAPGDPGGVVRVQALETVVQFLIVSGRTRKDRVGRDQVRLFVRVVRREADVHDQGV